MARVLRDGSSQTTLDSNAINDYGGVQAMERHLVSITIRNLGRRLIAAINAMISEKFEGRELQFDSAPARVFASLFVVCQCFLVGRDSLSEAR